MNKRDFIKSSLFAGIGIMSFGQASGSQKQKKSAGYKNWIWENPNHTEEESHIKERFSRFY
ncbi:MAG: hypothetical protein K0M50_03050 [Prolixibacteraceae bacterium]|nr:hypothetical protein [Prolixibacteraceae bacterium]